MTEEPAGDDWSTRRRDAAAEHAARLERGRAAETERAAVMVADFVRDARERGLPTVPLKARAHNGRSLYRTGLTGWYLRRNHSLAVGTDGGFYLMSAPTSLAARLRGTTLASSDPPLVVGAGGRDGESIPLGDLLRDRLDLEDL